MRYQSRFTTLPSFRATMFCQAVRSTAYLTTRTEPSPQTTLNPPGWADPKKSHMPASVLTPDGSRHGRLRFAASWAAGLSWPGGRRECRALIQVDPFAHELLSPHWLPPYLSIETYFSPTSTVLDVPSLMVGMETRA